MPTVLQLPATTIPMDGATFWTLELGTASPAGGSQASVSQALSANPYALLGSLVSPQGATQLQVQIAQQMLAFATQQATLLQQALPFMLNTPPAR